MIQQIMTFLFDYCLHHPVCGVFVVFAVMWGLAEGFIALVNLINSVFSAACILIVCTIHGHGPKATVVPLAKSPEANTLSDKR